MTCVICSLTWLIISVIEKDIYFGVSQGLAALSNFIQAMFYLWASESINENDSPRLFTVMTYAVMIVEMCVDTKRIANTKLFKIQHKVDAILNIK